MRKIQFREALREAMSEEMRKDGNIYLMGEEVAEYNGAYKVSQGMLAEFGAKRVIDTPISECGFSGIGIGSAMAGLRPIIEFMTFNFAMVAIDQIVNGAAKIKNMSGGQFSVPIVFRGATGNAGMLSSQHSQCFESWYANCPGLKVVLPATPYDAKGLLKSAILDPDPVIFMESELMYGDVGEVPEEEYYIEIGKAKMLTEGKDITIVGFGKIIKVAIEAANELLKEGIHAEVIDLRTVRPIDYQAVINSVKKTNRLIIVEESWPLGSISTEIAFKVQKEAFDYLDAPVARVTGADVPLPYSPTLIQEYLPNASKVVRVAKELMYQTI